MKMSPASQDEVCMWFPWKAEYGCVAEDGTPWTKASAEEEHASAPRTCFSLSQELPKSAGSWGPPDVAFPFSFDGIGGCLCCPWAPPGEFNSQKHKQHKTFPTQCSPLDCLSSPRSTPFIAINRGASELLGSSSVTAEIIASTNSVQIWQRHQCSWSFMDLLHTSSSCSLSIQPLHDDLSIYRTPDRCIESEQPVCIIALLRKKNERISQGRSIMKSTMGLLTSLHKETFF